jgi:tRNA (guanine37-N1)-methyltransferase
MRIEAITVFPELFDWLNHSLIGKAQEKQLIQFSALNPRDFTTDVHKTVDDSPYGGGAGMVMKPEPLGQALDRLIDGDTTVIFPTPAGKLFNQEVAKQLSGKKHLVFVCGRYEGVDQRVVEYASSKADTMELSIGDYVINGGEAASVVMIEAISRLIPGVIGNSESLIEESHEDGLVEYPSYTKPASWNGLDVPEVLLSGNHAEIAKWRKQQQLQRTKKNRPDLI